MWHGTYAECFPRIAWTNRFEESSQTRPAKGDCRTPFPAVFLADSRELAYYYSWPSNFLLDSLFYGLTFEVEIDPRYVLERRKTWRQGGEVLVCSGNILIRGVYLFHNMYIAQGKAKKPEWEPWLELLPDSLLARRGTLLRPEPLRSNNWWV